MLFQFDLSKQIRNESLPEFAGDYYRTLSLVVAVIISLTICLIFMILLMFLSAYHIKDDVKKYANELIRLELRLKQQSVVINTAGNVGDSNSQFEIRAYITEQERKISELEPLVGGRVSALGALAAIEKSIPERILLNRLEYSFSSNDLIVYILTLESRGVEEMVVELEALGVFRSVAIVKKERLRNQELYYEVEMQI